MNIIKMSEKELLTNIFKLSSALGYGPPDIKIVVPSSTKNSKYYWELRIVYRKGYLAAWETYDNQNEDLMTVLRRTYLFLKTASEKTLQKLQASLSI